MRADGVYHLGLGESGLERLSGILWVEGKKRKEQVREESDPMAHPSLQGLNHQLPVIELRTPGTA